MEHTRKNEEKKYKLTKKKTQHDLIWIFLKARIKFKRWRPRLGIEVITETLEHRRNLNRITMLYKITNNLIAVDPKLYLTPQPYLSTRNNNPLQYQIISTRTNYYKYSFSPHAVVFWNSLPYTVVNAGSLDQIQGQNI